MNKLQRKVSNISLCEEKTQCILFTADWCSACINIESLFDNKKIELQSHVKFEKINVDSENADCKTIKHKIIKIPTLVIIKNGKSKNYINEEITENIFNDLSNKNNDNELEEHANIIIDRQ
jgi:thiol-disulfide isomerase/thioredoxin